MTTLPQQGGERSPTSDATALHAALRTLSKYGIIVAFFVLCAVLAVFEENFLTTNNLLNVLRQTSINGILAIGMTFVILTRGIDLSVGSIVALAGVVSATFATMDSRMQWVPETMPLVAIMLGIMAGMLTGAINGFLVARFAIPAFVVTLGMLSAARGGTLLWTGGLPVPNLDPTYRWIGDGVVDVGNVWILAAALFALLGYIGIGWLNATERRNNGALGASASGTRKLSALAVSAVAAVVLAFGLAQALPAIGIGQTHLVFTDTATGEEFGAFAVDATDDELDFFAGQDEGPRRRVSVDWGAEGQQPTADAIIAAAVERIDDADPALVTLDFDGLLVPMTAVEGLETGLDLRLGSVGLPVPAILFVLIFLAAWVVLNRTRYGRYVYAVGGNEKSAKTSGINTKAVILSVYVISGALAAVGGMVLAARTGSALTQAGVAYELDAIAAVVIGGTSLAGGVGTVVGTFFGALIIGVMTNGLQLMGVDAYYQQVIKGIIIVIAVMLDPSRRQRA